MFIYLFKQTVRRLLHGSRPAAVQANVKKEKRSAGNGASTNAEEEPHVEQAQERSVLLRRATV